ncbi:hypothetical protein MHB44_03745 [Lysinibacillus sp. FSL H8-0500]|uniref:IS66 family insertion sequence element accessory protein TnpA n=1 Tax=Lysinibacillus sp. FSL H8-0500 TaxID=2921393 RepID=UPI003101209F
MSLDERKQMWQQRIEDYRSSGEPSVKAWCQLNQVGLQSMYQWMRRLQLEATHVAPTSTSTQWVTFTSSNGLDKTTTPLIVKIGDVSIEISEGFDRVLFTEVLQILQVHVQ